jgi:undecaprenyl diphosphate synthase
MCLTNFAEHGFTIINFIVILVSTIIICTKYFQFNKYYSYPLNAEKLHVAVMCDGNRRWGTENGVGKLGGYEKGEQNCLNCVKWGHEMNLNALTLFIFGADNFKRDEKEVEFLFGLMRQVTHSKSYEKYIKENNIKFKFLTTTQDVPDISKDVFTYWTSVQNETADNTGMIFQLGIGYSGRADVEQAASKTLLGNGTFKDNLATAGVDNPDILIRTSGEQRLSDFMLYQMAYTEVFFLPKKWPDFTKDDLIKVLYEYSKRNKRMGK